ncbi:radical SAM protein [Sporichthya sp.]|uniref:radical SAM protein n=1 Tax=Sporichthya sp. TaxID=65475 RepID=UPI00180A098D|nr:radical SAM protein [Sporichthya sp.]MBA3743839.1 radical SAM protein [Sporichthya sp.]
MATEAMPTAAAELDGGAMDCGSGLLLLLMRTIRGIDPGQVLLVRTEEPSVPPDLDDWARLAGHEILAAVADAPGGPWQVAIRRGGAPGPAPEPAAVFSGGAATPVGHRLWLYSNFHCNLACSYCCAKSSPQASPRQLSAADALEAATQFAALGGRELIVTGGEPFLHPQIGAMVTGLAALLPVTVLTNAMVFERGARRDALESMPRDRVNLQISLDSAEADLHDRQRGAGSHAKALAGIAQARALGFTVRIAATLHDADATAVGALNTLLDTLGIEPANRLIRPVAAQGYATAGLPVGIDTLEPEPTLTTEGIWWHPVAVTDPAMRIGDATVPLSEALGIIRDTLAVQDAAHREGRRHVFRCA